MTQIEFIYNLESYQEGLYYILNKRYKNQRAMIFCDDDKISYDLSDFLWKHSGFYPNTICNNQLPKDYKPGEIFYISQHFNKNFDDLLINASGQEYSFFSRFEKFFELVLKSEKDKTNARERLKKYREGGYEVALIESKY